MNRLSRTFQDYQKQQKKKLMVYINAGDPDLESTYHQIEIAIENGADIIELGVPFSNSFTDGEAVKASHNRALMNGVTFGDVCTLASDIRKSFDIPIVLLVDFSHSVKSRGLKTIVSQAADSGIDALLLHGLPPLFANQFVDLCGHYQISPIFSVYPKTNDAKIREIVVNAKGFLYLVSSYGRSGNQSGNLLDQTRIFAHRVREHTDLPLLLGFGIQTPKDVENAIKSDDIDGVIIGSALTRIVARHQKNLDALYQEFGQEIANLSAACHLHHSEPLLES